MKIDSNFKSIGNGPKVTIEFDGESIEVRDEVNLAAALLEAGVSVFRESMVSGQPRGPFCLMGSCFECLVEIDGEIRQACMETARKGMVIKRGGADGL